ncbi:cytochrome P450 [Aspergillus ibericus CBS 121593]|uniref:Cytochrome P450 n=1 Tax=Aspergillus ibericus CBS 121593 TaxID=1448316 RepID=A0A395H640_9EURO|nr:cytochrome P450 [Aspergillus ibericus CBS 121593]RAL03066.1 cytochrome P450 [Aspergillus ibericus CBS 121593]
MPHSLVFGHLLIVLRFYRDWAFDANFIQTFGFYMSKHWIKFFPDEKQCPPVIYVDVWPISRPMAFSMKAYVSNQMEIGSSLPKSPMQGEFLDPITSGKDLNCMHGEEWRMWRSRFNPGFSRGNIRTWIPAILEEVEAFANELKNLSGGTGEWGQVFPMEQISSNLALDVTGRVVLNTRLNSQSPYPSPFTVAFREQLTRMEITLSPRKLLWRATPWFKLLVRRKRQQIFQYIRPYITDSIGVASPGPRTIIRSAVEEYSQELATKATGANVPDDEFVEYVFSQLMIFFFGGDDALSLTIPRVFRQLQLNPESVAKLQAEHDTVLGSDPSLAAARIREVPHILDSLPYTLGVIKETLRMNPATITIREGQPSFTFRIDGADEPWPTDGFDLFDSSITIHNDPAVFPDPEKFIPERFLVPEGDRLHPAKDIWRGFQLGPRRCIGQELAIVVLKLVLVFTVRTLDIEMAWDEWDRLRELQGLKVDRRMVEGDRMYTTGKATAHAKDGAPMHVRVRTSSDE